MQKTRMFLTILAKCSVNLLSTSQIDDTGNMLKTAHVHCNCEDTNATVAETSILNLEMY